MPSDDRNQQLKNYQWPADKLTAAEMAVLHRLREVTGRPINHLLREAILKLSETSGAETLNKIGEQDAEKK